MKRQAGFTLIELVMVIVILGILSAFALPRFADLGSEARQASLVGLAGAIRSAASIAHAEQLVAGDTLGAGVTLEGTAIDMVNGYPRADAGGIGAAADISTSDYAVSTTDGFGGGDDGGDAIRYTLQNSDTCSVTYTAANADDDNTAPLTANFSVVVDDSGC